jgi:hypothetical protein
MPATVMETAGNNEANLLLWVNRDCLRMSHSPKNLNQRCPKNRARTERNVTISPRRPDFPNPFAGICSPSQITVQYRKNPYNRRQTEKQAFLQSDFAEFPMRTSEIPSAVLKWIVFAYQ